MLVQLLLQCESSDTHPNASRRQSHPTCIAWDRDLVSAPELKHSSDPASRSFACIRTHRSTRMIPAARPARTCENRPYPERKVRPVKSFRAKGILWIQNPLPTTNRHDSARVGAV